MNLVFTVLILLAFVALGVAMAADFRGVTTEFAERSVATPQPFGERLRRRRSPEATRRRVVVFTIVQRIIGLLFAVVCLAGMIAVIVTA